MFLYYTATGGEYTIIVIGLAGHSVAGRIYRQGIEYRPSGVTNNGNDTPIGKQFSFDPANGAIGFDTNLPALENGETIDVPILNPA